MVETSASSKPLKEEVTLRMKASMVSNEDVRETMDFGSFGRKSGVLGTTGAAVVTAVGSDVSTVKTGDLVLVSNLMSNDTGGGGGLWCSGVDVTVPITSVVPVNPAITTDPVEAATLPLTLSAYHILSQLPSVSSSEEGETATVVLDAQGDGLLTAIASLAAAMSGSSGKKVKLEVHDSTTRLALKNCQLAVTSRPGANSVNMLRTLGPRGTLFVYNDDTASLYGPHADITVNIPVASSIFQDVSVVGFEWLSWHKADPRGVAAAMAGLQEVLHSSRTSLGDLQGSGRGSGGRVSIETFVDNNGGSGTVIDLA
jgi:hypothetical protein